MLQGVYVYRADYQAPWLLRTNASDIVERLANL